MNHLGAFVLIMAGLVCLMKAWEPTPDLLGFIACMGWAAALVNRAEIEKLKGRER